MCYMAGPRILSQSRMPGFAETSLGLPDQILLGGSRVFSPVSWPRRNAEGVARSYLGFSG